MVAVVRLARLPSDISDQPELLARYWDEAMSAIEKSLNAIIAIPEIQSALNGVSQATVEAKAAAKAAQDAADNASMAASSAATAASAASAKTAAQAQEASLVNSYVTNYTGDLITATAAGIVTIAAHDRVYGDSTLNPTVHVNGGTLNTGGVSADVVRVYYSDPSRSGGAVTYQYTIDPQDPPVQGGSTHSVGAVTVPASGSQPGKGVKNPGFVDL